MALMSSWTPTKQEEMDRRLQSLMEELVRTENSYVSRILALQKVGRRLFTPL